MIPRVAHFVFGLRPQRSPFHFLHYASIESCRRLLEPETIFFHHKNLPYGPWWDRIRPHVTLVAVDDVPEVAAADYSAGLVPARYRYAHHADFLRLDALIEHGGVYADIDTIFVRPFPDELYAAPFVIGREPAVRDEHTGETRPSLCNALLMAEKGSAFARTWRARMAAELNGSWSNHSGFLSAALSTEMPSAVRVEPETTFYAFASHPAGLAQLLVEDHAAPADALSVHLWAHLWWERDRLDFSVAHAGWYTPATLARTRTTLSRLTRDYLPQGGARAVVRPGDHWTYLAAPDEHAEESDAVRLVAALGTSGLVVSSVQHANGSAARDGNEPVTPPASARDESDGSEVIVAELSANDLPDVREGAPGSFLVARVAWDDHLSASPWIPCFNQADLIVVPSRFSQERATASGLQAPVVVIPPVAPPENLEVNDEGLELPDALFVFYAIGAWTAQNAIFDTVEAYLRAFSAKDRVLLVVSTSARDHTSQTSQTTQRVGPGTTAWTLARLLARHGEPPAIRLVTGAFGAPQTTALHRRGDCFVSLGRNEAWNHEAYRAASFGKPVVITSAGGHMDYLHDSPSLVSLESSTRSRDNDLASVPPDSAHDNPDIAHAAQQLRAVYADQAGATARAGATAERIRRTHSPSEIAAQWRAVIDDYATRELPGRPPMPIEPQ